MSSEMRSHTMTLTVDQIFNSNKINNELIESVQQILSKVKHSSKISKKLQINNAR